MEPVIAEIKGTNGELIKLGLYPENDTADSLNVISEEEAFENGEASCQLREGCSYEYELTPGYSFEEISGIVKQSRRTSSSGRIVPGIYVGTLILNVLDKDNSKAGTFQLEIRSSKSSYREDYRYMLESITEYCTDILMQHSSPAVQNFTQDYSSVPETLYQRFAFIKSIIDSAEFSDAIHRIISDPVTIWCEIEEDTDIRRMKRPGGAGLRQIASGRNRIGVPADHPLNAEYNFKSLPARLSLNRKIETADTPENRFIKHALEVFAGFCSMVRTMLSDTDRESFRTFIEALQLEEYLGQTLSHSLFRQISKPLTLPLNSPVLQRREGYREVLRAWLMFDLAAKLAWHGGEDVYSAGKRDVAQLYEYWLFFRLLEIMKGIFNIEPDSIDSLIGPTNDGLGLMLRSGKSTPLKGIYIHPVRKLNVEFTYNRTFSGRRKYPDSGSWSRKLRPDYTLSLWPADFEKDDAERQEIITHIHFDAKYRVESLKDILGDEELDLDEEKKENRSGSYKRADLLKMHAYKDAIRRTGGAYVLYPGDDEPERLEGFHEILPGLGAFAVRPSGGDDGSEHLKHFIQKVVEHFLNRASQHERMTYYTYDTHRKNKGSKIKEPIPECDAGIRVKPPTDIQVLVGYYREKQREWISRKRLYNIRFDERVTPEMTGAQYLLLYNKETNRTGELFEIIKSESVSEHKSGPIFWDKQKMLKEGYTDPRDDGYFVYSIKRCNAPEFAGRKWDISKLKNYRSDYYPFTATLAEMMMAKVQIEKSAF